MEIHNNIRSFFFLYSLLIPLHLARPGISSSLYLESSPQFEPVSSPSVEPTSVSSPSPGAFVLSPSSGLGQAPGQASVPSPFPGPASGPLPNLGLTPMPAPSSGQNPGPTQSSGPTPGPSPSSVLAPGPALGPSISSGPGQAPGQSPPSGLSPGPSSSSELAPVPSPSLGQAPGPSPSISDSPKESNDPFQFEFSPILAPSADVDPKVNKICDSTDDPFLCLATVVPNLNGKTDVSSVLNVAIRAGSKISKDAQVLAQKLAGEPGKHPELASVLTDCKRSYNIAVENYENAIDAFPEHDIGTMNSMLSAVITNVGDCEDAFSKQGQDSPFSDIAVRLKNMTSNCLAIISLLD